MAETKQVFALVEAWLEQALKLGVTLEEVRLALATYAAGFLCHHVSLTGTCERQTVLAECDRFGDLVEMLAEQAWLRHLAGEPPLQPAGLRN